MDDLGMSLHVRALAPHGHIVIMFFTCMWPCPAPRPQHVGLPQPLPPPPTANVATMQLVHAYRHGHGAAHPVARIGPPFPWARALGCLMEGEDELMNAGIGLYI
jgi:hypothetical protein